MKNKNRISNYTLTILICISHFCYTQIPNSVYIANEDKDNTTIQHELKIKDGYLIYNEFQTAPPKFIKTLGGFYTTENDSIKVDLEFNSNFENDSLRLWKIGYDLKDFDMDFNGMTFKPKSSKEQDLDGMWLFATRGPDTGQERRGEDSARKTLKILLNGHFHWVAYNTETFKFSGTGGGTYTSEDGRYTETIDFFSRDDSRVGARLEFNYDLKGKDWHQKGNNSRGEPMYEIWARRK